MQMLNLAGGCVHDVHDHESMLLLHACQEAGEIVISSAHRPSDAKATYTNLSCAALY